MSDAAPGSSRAPRLSLPWLAAFLGVAVVAGLVSGAVVALLTGDGDDGDSGGSNQAVAQAVARALPSVVAIVNEISPSGGDPRGISGGAGGVSDDLALGETVIALGSPDIDYMNSASVGVISGLERRKPLGDVWLEDLVQTD